MKQIWVLAGRYRYQLGLGVVVLLAVLMRFYQLSTLPPGLHSDEAANGLDILRILGHHDFRPFYSTNGGREALFFYFQAIGVQLFGTTILGLRVMPALIGVLAVIMTYVWIANWFSKRTALVAALIMAVSPWAVTISRDGYRAGMVALMVPLILWLYTKAVQTGRLVWYMLAGVSLGLGFYTYPSFWTVPLLLISFLSYFIVKKRVDVSTLTAGVARSLVGTAVVLVPMIWYGSMHLGEVFGRAGGVSVFNEPGGPVGIAQALSHSVVKTLFMFNVHGDENYRHNLGGQPELNVFVGAMFLLGIMLCIAYRKRQVYLGLLAVLIAMLTPAMVTSEGVPHALRAYSAFPAVAGLAALGTLYLVDQWRAIFPINAVARMLGSGAVLLLLLLTVYQGYTQYFVAWANSPATYKAYQENSVSLARYYNAHPFSGKRYVLAGAYKMMPTEFLTHNHATYQRLTAGQIQSLPLETGTAKEFSIFTEDIPAVLPALQRKFPKLDHRPHYSSFDGRQLFVVYVTPAP